MSMQKIRDAYGVPAKRGMSVRFPTTGRYGVIVGSRDGLLRIRLEGKQVAHEYHPTYVIEYIGKNGSVIWPKEGGKMREVTGIDYHDQLAPYRVNDGDAYLDPGYKAILFALEMISIQLHTIGMIMVESRKEG